MTGVTIWRGHSDHFWPDEQYGDDEHFCSNPFEFDVGDKAPWLSMTIEDCKSDDAVKCRGKQWLRGDSL